MCLKSKPESNGARNSDSSLLHPRPTRLSVEGLLRSVLVRATNLSTPTLGLRVKLRPVCEASGRRVEEPEQAARRTVVYVYPSLGGHHAALASPVQVTSISG